MISSVIFIISANAFALKCTVGESLSVPNEQGFLQLQAESKTQGTGMNELFEMIFKTYAVVGAFDIEGSAFEINPTLGKTLLRMKMITADIEKISNDPDRINDNFSSMSYSEFQKLQAEIKAAPKTVQDFIGQCKIKQSEKEVLRCGTAESLLEIDTKNNIISKTLPQQMSDGKKSIMFMNKISCQ